MPSPFPGMDPYLEAPARWSGVHQRLMTYISDTIQPRISPKYSTHLGERVYLLEPERSIYPDVTLVERRPTMPFSGGVAVAEVTLLEPLVLALPYEELRQPYIEIVHNSSGQVVTVLEVLSPANKTGSGHEKYLKKQAEVLNSEAHLVEIDLLSQGQWSIAWPEELKDSVPKHRYIICVNRGYNLRERYELYPLQLADKLPHFAIPLKANDPDVGLNLAAVFDKCYDNGGYTDFVDYSQPSPVPLSKEELRIGE
ncbi:DUF4058 family protein [Anaerolineales bacterium HSG6]|nr:DUF4058 family protein [Anaerolineales bacterium HSG6]